MRLLKSTRLIPRLGSEETRVHAPQLRDRTKLSGGRKLRHELKFIINEGTYLMLRARLAPLMTVDPHGVNGEYRVTSLYFDDVYNSLSNVTMASGQCTICAIRNVTVCLPKHLVSPSLTVSSRPSTSKPN